jgi:hypothetical protein
LDSAFGGWARREVGRRGVLVIESGRWLGLGLGENRQGSRN